MSVTESVEAKAENEQSPSTWKHGTFHWNELMTHNEEGARKFYSDTLGWTYESFAMPDGGKYWVIKSGPEIAGGIFAMNSPEHADAPECWMSYIAVDDVDARVEKALKAGATLMRPAFDIPGVGRVAMLREPGGAVIGWITS